jgi:FkbM family methyltransferase
MNASSALRHLLATSPFADIPIRIRHGPAKGAQWTLFPFSMYWRLGGDLEVAVAAGRLPLLEGASFWDFGAHFGIHTVAMALKIGPAGEVAAFEPDPFSFSKLSRHVELNRLHQVHLFNAAVSNYRGSSELITYGAGASTQHFAYPDDDGLRKPDEPFFLVRTVRADDLVANAEIRLPDLIKIDVEGHGGAALEGAAQSVRERRPVIVMSSHSRMETEGAKQVLEPLQYHVYAMNGASLTWDELTSNTRILVAT